MSNESRIRKLNTYELVADRLLEELVRAGRQPGAPVPTERELTERFGVGRSSVREALRMLESKGVIASVDHGKFVVADHGQLVRQAVQMLLALELSDLRELFELRRILEPELAAHAAARRSPEIAASLEEAVRQLEDTLPSPEGLQADRVFHVTIARASENRLALQVIYALWEPLSRALRDSWAPALSPGYAEEVVEQHRAILEAIAAGDVEAARESMRAHMAWVGSLIPEEQAVALRRES